MSALVAGLASAREVRVDCARAAPVQSLASALPAGVSPGSGLARLAVVRAARVGSARGPLRLLCGYRVQGQVVFVAQATPQGASACSADTRGFTCRIAASEPGRGRTLGSNAPPRLIGEERRTEPPRSGLGEPLQPPPAPRLAPPSPVVEPNAPPEARVAPEQETERDAPPPITRPGGGPVAGLNRQPLAPPATSGAATIGESSLGQVLDPLETRRETPRSNAPPAPAPNTPRPAPAPPQSGRLAIPPSWTADLDQGRVGAGPESDVWLRTPPEGRDGPRLLESINGAVMAQVGRALLDRAGCEAAALSDLSFDLTMLGDGDVFCLRTTDGRIAQFRIAETSSSRSSALVIDFQTW